MISKHAFGSVVLGVILGLSFTSTPTIAQPATVRGTILQVILGSPARVVVKTDTAVISVTVTETTIIQRRNEGGGVSKINLGELRVGDEVIIAVSENNEALSVLASAPQAQQSPKPPETSPQGLIGIYFDPTASPPEIVVLDGSPAAQAGLITGDKVVEMNGRHFDRTLQAQALPALQFNSPSFVAISD